MTHSSVWRACAGRGITRRPPRGLFSTTFIPKTIKERAAHIMRGTINVEFSALLYFYWDFGVFGVVVGLLAYGVLARYLYEYLLVRAPTLYGQVMFALALWFVVIGLRDGPVDAFVRGWFVLAPVWLVFALARSRLLAHRGVGAIDDYRGEIAR